MGKVAITIENNRKSIDTTYEEVVSGSLRTAAIIADGKLTDLEKKELIDIYSAVSTAVKGMENLPFLDSLRMLYDEIEEIKKETETILGEYQLLLSGIIEQGNPASLESFQILMEVQRQSAEAVRSYTHWLHEYMGQQQYFYRTLYFLFIGVAAAGFFLYQRQGKVIAVQRERHKEMSKLTQKIVASQEQERKRLDLHDTIAQELSALMVSIETMNDGIDVSPAVRKHLRMRVRKVSVQARDVLTHVRQISYELKPPSLDEYGFLQSIERLCSDFDRSNGIVCRFDSEVTDDEEIPENIKINLYRVVQEGLTNIKKHSGADTASVELTFYEKGLELTIRDNGKGFTQEMQSIEKKVDPAEQRGSKLGLKGITERIQTCGGTFVIKSRPREGTKLIIQIPLRRQQ